LDETTEQQSMICQGLLNIVAAHPGCRVIITTRPVGYQSALLGEWRRYKLLPLDPSAVSGHVHRLIQHVAPSRAESVSKFLEAQLKTNEAARVEARSPLLLTLMVSLAVRNIPFASSRVELYERLFQTYADGVADRLPLPEGVARETAVRFRERLGQSTLYCLGQPGRIWRRSEQQMAMRERTGVSIATVMAGERSCWRIRGHTAGRHRQD
jgi:hypothetical protein